MTSTPNSLRATLIANYAGRLWSGLANFAFVPLYVGYLGLESWGLMGVYASLQIWLSLLDLGLSTSVNRLLAQSSTPGAIAGRSRDLVRTYEICYWVMGLCAALAVVAAAPLIAHHWLRPDTLTPTSITSALILIAALLAVQWPSLLYSGGLSGIGQQVRLNIVRSAATLTQVVGSLVVLAFLSPTIEAFFCWQIAVQALQSLMLRWLLWRELPGPRPRMLRWGEWREERGFATGMVGITVLGTILTQLDKVVLSRALSLEEFGRYALVVAAASSLALVSSPIAMSVFPRFVRLAVAADDTELRELYHRTSGLTAVATIPLAILLILFPAETLTAWLGTAGHANAHWLALQAAGSACNALVLVPFMLQLAHGWTSLSLRKNLIAITLWIPLMLVLVDRQGAAGAALAWLALNLGYLLIEIPIMHARLLRGAALSWYRDDLAPALMSSILVVGGARLVLPEGMDRLTTSAALLAILTTAMLACLAAMPRLLRHLLLRAGLKQ